MIGGAEALARVMSGADLTRSETEEIFGQLMDGELEEGLKAGLLVALAVKGESPDEVAGAAAAMRRRVVRIPHGRDDLVDTCGTGGDGKGTFNISTAAALVAAAAGVTVAKHGNRSVSSRSGSADVLAALGARIDLTPEEAVRALDEVGLAFLFAPRLHPAMREVMPVRRALGVRTVFNLLGPLTNPAGARRQVLGVYGAPQVDLVVQVLAELGSEHALVVHGADGLDEISTTGTTRIAELRNGVISLYQVEPEELGVPRVPIEALAGGGPEENAERMREVFSGRSGPLADIAAVNAGAAIYVAGLAEDLPTGVSRALEVLASGAAADRLQAVVAFGQGAP